MEDKKVLLTIEDLEVKFRVRGRILTAIRGISLDIYENETIAIVGESGSGKSVFTKTFAGMLDSNGYVSQGRIIFHDEELADTKVALSSSAKKKIEKCRRKLNEYAKLEAGADTYKAILELESERRQKSSVSDEKRAEFEKELKELEIKKVNLFNYKQTLDSSKEKDKIKETSAQISELENKIKNLKKEEAETEKSHKAAVAADSAYLKQYDAKMAELKSTYDKQISGAISKEQEERNVILAKEIYLSVGRYNARKRNNLIAGLLKALKEAMKLGVDLSNEDLRNKIFDDVAFRVKYLDETPKQLHGVCVLNLANVKYEKDWSKIRGKKIATVFQDPMTSLNPIITIGKQITSIILKHQDVTEGEARRKALELMAKVGIPSPEVPVFRRYETAYRYRNRSVLPAEDFNL